MLLADDTSPAPVGFQVRDLARDTLFNHAGRIAPGVVSLVLLPVLVRTAGADAYGVWLALLALIAGLTSFDLGLASAVTQAVTEARVAAVEEREVRSFVRSAFALTFALAFGLAAAAALLAPPVIANLDFQGANVPLLCGCMAVIVVGSQVNGFCLWVLSGIRRFDVVNGIAGGISVLRMTGSVAVVYGGYGLSGLAVWHALSSLGAAGASASAIARLAPSYRLSLRGVRLSHLRGRATFSAGSQGVHVINVVAGDTLPVLLIGSILGPGAIVVYHLGQRFAGLAAQFFSATGSVLFTAACEAGSERSQMEEVLRGGTRWMAVFGFPVCTILFILAPDVLLAWLGSADPAMVLVLRLGSLTVLLTAIGETSLYAVWVTAVDKVLWAGGLALVLLFVALYPLIGRYGVPGAALALLLHASVLNVALLTLAVRIHRLQPSSLVRATFGGLIVPTAAAGLVITGGALWLNPATVPALAAVVGVAAMVFGVIFYVNGATPTERRLVGAALGRVRTSARAAFRRSPPHDEV